MILSICKQQKYFCASNLTLVLTWWSHIGLLFTNEEQDTKPLLCCVHAGRERNDWQPCQPRPRRRRKSFRKRYSKRLVRSWVRIGETESCSVFVQKCTAWEQSWELVIWPKLKRKTQCRFECMYVCVHVCVEGWGVCLC